MSRLIWTILSVATLLSLVKAQNDAEPLFWTPLINSGSIDSARTLCKVGNLPLQVDNGIIERESCSGFITVNETFNSNLFFWFFPALNDPENAPVILWLEGGPGVSGHFSFFVGHGPYLVNSNVGTVFSFTENENGYSKTSEESAENNLEFLKQFFTLFPEYQQNAFYVAGASYGAHFGPPLAAFVHNKNQEEEGLNINLTALIMFVPWTSPLDQVDAYSDYLYSNGLVDSNNLTYFKAEEAKTKEFIQNQEYSNANMVLSSLIGGTNSTFNQVTGFSDTSNLLQEIPDLSIINFVTYAEMPAFRSAIHVGNTTFNFLSLVSYLALNEDFMRSESIYIEEILNATVKEYQVLVISGQFDLTVIHTGVEKMLNELNWNGSAEFKEVGRNIWKVGYKIAGYVKKVKNLNYVLMRNAGHAIFVDQPEWNLELINQLSLS